jgi:hypothetical protein
MNHTGSGNPGKLPMVSVLFVPAWHEIFMLLLVCRTLSNKFLLLNTFTVLQLSRRIQLVGILLGPVVSVCPVSPRSLFGVVVLLLSALLRLSVSAVTVVALLIVLLEVETEPTSELSCPEWMVLSGSEVVELR